MHELEITKKLLSMIMKRSKDPRSAVVEIGSITTYKKEPLLYYFDLLKKDNDLDMKLDVVEVQAKAKCTSCSKIFEVEDFAFFCPVCGSDDIDVIEGDDIILKEIIER